MVYNIILLLFACICLCLSVVIMYDKRATFAMRLICIMIIIAVYLILGVLAYDSVI